MISHQCDRHQEVTSRLDGALQLVRLRGIGPVPFLALPGAVESAATHAPFTIPVFHADDTEAHHLECGKISGVLETQ